MTYEQLLQQIRAGAINFVFMFRGPDKDGHLVPFYNVPITREQHEQIADVLRLRNVDLTIAVWFSFVEVCIDQANHKPHHFYVSDAEIPHSRCGECARIRERICPKSEKEWEAHIAATLVES